MKLIYFLLPALLSSAVVVAQVSGQQPDPPQNLTDEVKALREDLLQMQKQLVAQQQEIRTLKAQPPSGQITTGSTAPMSGATETAAVSTSPVNSNPTRPTTAISNNVGNVAGQPTAQQTEPAGANVSPTFIKLGDAVLTPGGFVDFENIFRTTNTQSNIATAFGSIPYNNTAQGRITEYRSTAQFSRLNLKITDSFRGNDITGYVEGDFSGNSATNVYQSVNGHTNRLRLYFGSFKRGKWEILGGQTWSWLTPNRDGIGPIPVDLAITYNEDQNLGVGVPYTRAAEFRVAYHLNDHWAMGVGIEDPNQYIGTFVALPAQFTSIGTQFDNGSQIGAANAFPDVLAKITHDTNLAGKHFHAEVTGLLNGAHASAMPVGSASFKTHSTVGGGGEIAANYELFPKFVLLGNAFWSDGGAHYLVATGPQLVVRPNAAGTDVNLSMVHAGAGSAGFEWRATPKHAFAAYYGADYFGRNFFTDTTNAAHPGSIIGFGGPGSPNTNNRALQQVTFDWLLTFWKNERYGAVQYYTQYSYLTRAPWFVAPGDPKNAHLSMVYAGIRYVLPSTSGTLLRVPYPN